MIADSGLSVSGRIDTKTYNEESLPVGWDKMSDKEKLSALNGVEADEEQTDYNTTVFGMHEYFAQELDPTQTVSEDVTHLAVGDDDTDPNVNNDTLNNEIFRKEVTDHSQNGEEILASTFIDTDEGNGQTFREVGLFAGPDTTDVMWNHSTIAAIEKDSTRTITVDVTLSFSAE